MAIEEAQRWSFDAIDKSGVGCDRFRFRQEKAESGWEGRLLVEIQAEIAQGGSRGRAEIGKRALQAEEEAIAECPRRRRGKSPDDPLPAGRQGLL